MEEKMKIGRMVLGQLQTNCYLIYEEEKKEAIFVDPATKGDWIYEKLNELGFTVAGILLTHAHHDHICGAEKLRELTGAKIYACEEERELCRDPRLNLSGMFGRKITIEPDVYLKDGEEVTIAGMTAKVIATPGHTKGSCCFYFEEDKMLISGDTLFMESTGRTDFPTGSTSAIVRSIKEKLFVLPGDTKVYPGHGDETTIAYEKMYNPFVQ